MKINDTTIEVLLILCVIATLANCAQNILTKKEVTNATQTDE